MRRATWRAAVLRGALAIIGEAPSALEEHWIGARELFERCGSPGTYRNWRRKFTSKPAVTAVAGGLAAHGWRVRLHTRSGRPPAGESCSSFWILTRCEPVVDEPDPVPVVVVPKTAPPVKIVQGAAHVVRVWLTLPPVTDRMDTGTARRLLESAADPWVVAEAGLLLAIAQRAWLETIEYAWNVVGEGAHERKRWIEFAAVALEGFECSARLAFPLGVEAAGDLFPDHREVPHRADGRQPTAGDPRKVMRYFEGGDRSAQAAAERSRRTPDPLSVLKGPNDGEGEEEEAGGGQAAPSDADPPGGGGW